MDATLRETLKSPALNGWPLFWLIVAPLSVVMVGAMARLDMASAEGVSAMIRYSVRCAVPLLYLAFSASSLVVLKPAAITRWLLRNRRIIGLCFAAAMAWQALFIVWLVTLHREYYLAEVYVLRDVIEGLAGYGLLLAMTLTSFHFGRRLLSAGQWKLLHKVGIYTLWMYAFGVYWWEVAYYPDPGVLDWTYYLAGFLAWGTRVAAWARKRRQQVAGTRPARFRFAVRTLGPVLVALGLLAAGTGALWYAYADAWLTGHAVTRIPELYLPYWPFEPFYPVLLILAGAVLISRRGAAGEPGESPGGETLGGITAR